jgi:transposase
MALGRRASERQAEFWVPTADLPRTPGHPFYFKLNELLAESGFDRFVEQLCEPHYAQGGRPSIPPGVYFRMLFIGYFEGLDSQRGIAWRCADSLALKQFLGYGLTDGTPDHSSLTNTRQRLPELVHEQVFTRILQLAREKRLLKGQTVGVDATLLEANAAMKSIVRKDTGDDWKAWLRKLAQEEGLENPSDDDLKKFDQGRKNKKVSNQEWESKSDPAARIMKMKDGRTHLAYKAEHAVDLESGLLLAATIHAGDAADGDSLLQTVIAAQANLVQAGSDAAIRDVPTDNGYHKNETLAQCDAWGIRTYCAEKQEKYQRVWIDKPAEQERAFRANRRRVRGQRGKALQRRRSEFCERSFAHSCKTGAARRSWLRSLLDVAKRYVVHAAALNLGVLMRKLFGIGTPRTLQGRKAGWFATLHAAAIDLLNQIPNRQTQATTARCNEFRPKPMLAA